MTTTLLPTAPEQPEPAQPDGTPFPLEPGQDGAARRSVPARLSSLAGNLAETGLLAVAVVVGGLPWRFFYTGDVVVPIAVSAGVATAVVLLLRRAPWWAQTFVGLVATVLVAATTIAARGEGGMRAGPQELREALRGIVHGWADLLTITVPADFAGEVAVPPLLLAGVAATLAGVLALRTRFVLLPLAPPVAAFVTTLIFTSWTPKAKAHDGYALTAVLVALLICELFLRTNRIALRTKPVMVVVPEGGVIAESADAEGGAEVGLDATRNRARAGLSRLLFGAPAVVAIIIGGVLLATALPVSEGREPYDPTKSHHEEIRVKVEVSPLATVKPQLTLRPPVTLFTVRVDQPADPQLKVDRIRTAALTDFDGAVWAVSGTYRRAGSVLPSPQLPSSGTARATVTVEGLEPPFLPALASPDTITGLDDLGYDLASGVLVTERRSMRGLRYAQTASVVPGGDKLTEFHPAVGPADALELPQRPDWLAQARIAAGATGKSTTLDDLRAIENKLRSGPYMSTATSGHSYFRIKQLLLGTEPADAAGYAEQRASAFAVLARSLGVPARVSVGYLLRNPEPDGSYKVTTADITAWPEVRDANLGWVAFNPTIRQREQAPVDADDEGSPSGGANSGDRAPENDLPPVLFDRVEDPQPQHTGWREVLVRVGRIAAAGLAGLVVLLLAVALAKPLRRTLRRRRGTPSRRVLAAWREIGDRLAERGHRPDPTLTPAETVLASRELVPAGALPVMAQAAPLVSAALYAPVEPGEGAASEAWRLEAATRGELRRGTPFSTRVRNRFSPRPLLPRTRLGDRFRSAVRARRRRGRASRKDTR